ncbi:MAG TPA: hypothetical protein VHX86_12015 [Tepidisphaeraceae bacterium]|jgi:hypothetical protein|nr:hypothetical protein [Tepidisphaeraceae bacterium]
MNKNKLVELVKSHLKKVGHGISFEVITDGVRQEESWWYVPVLATRKGKDLPREITVNIYANIEDELERKKRINVLFVPAVSETADQRT